VRTQIEQGQTIWQEIPTLSQLTRPSEIVKRLDGLTDSTLLAGSAVAPTPQARQNIANYLSDWRYRQPTITGKDLLQMGLKPGPEFGKLLSHLRQGWLDGWIADTAQERKVLDDWLSGDKTYDGD
jgi:tRNA nucleotidyltransferase (CCA-adding enzyme)